MPVGGSPKGGLGGGNCEAKGRGSSYGHGAVEEAEDKGGEKEEEGKKDKRNMHIYFFI